MDIISTFNPPRMLMFGQSVYWCRSITQEDYALLTAWVSDVLPPDPDRTLPRLGSDEARTALNSQLGWTVQAWAALRHFGVSYEQAAALILAATETERARFTLVFYRVRPTYSPSGDASDIGEAWWGPSVAKLTERGLSVSQIGAMTLDQVDMLFNDGLKNERPQGLEELSIDEVQAAWEAARTTAANGAED